MEQFLDLLLAFLLTNVDTGSIGAGNAISWIIGDPGMGAPGTLPFGFVVPLWDSVQPMASGIDDDTYVVPILIVDDLHKYGPPIENVNAPGTLEQPGYRVLMQLGQAVRGALRAGGAGITVEGVVATSVVPAINFVWTKIDNKPYRGVRIAYQVQQRRARPTLPVA